jgi:hypothetical protein
LAIFGVPLQATNLLLVTCKLSEILIRRANISVVDETVSGA